MTTNNIKADVIAITTATKLQDLQDLGATTLSDIPLNDLLIYVRNYVIELCQDTQACEEMGWGDDFAEILDNTEKSLEALERSTHR